MKSGYMFSRKFDEEFKKQIDQIITKNCLQFRKLFTRLININARVRKQFL